MTTDKRLDMNHPTEMPAVAKHKKPEFGLKRFALDQRLHRALSPNLTHETPAPVGRPQRGATSGSLKIGYREEEKIRSADNASKHRIAK
jgi:hypothetical protein